MSAVRQPPSLSAAAYRRVIDQRLREWDQLDEYASRTRDIPTARVVFVLAATAHNMARGAVHLWDGGFLVESMPNVRTCFEACVSAAWTQQTGRRGVEAYLYERARQSQVILRQLDEAGHAVPDAVRETVDTAPLLAQPPQLRDRARSIQAMCRDLDYSAGLYLMYRELSDEAHTSIGLIRHLARTPEDDLVHLAQPRHGQHADTLATFAVACALIWAGRAFSEVSLHKPHKRALRAAAQELGVPHILTAASSPRPPRTRSGS
ncbi:DUF5677 domain-containing protein [Micromonospora sp. CPCC 205558]|uniref:DUF5677 domain-containing protein n=1 Tax=Micromonospora sp. CPCC 205558 TaxID=3122403 RepID=UPI002FEF10FD